MYFPNLTMSSLILPNGHSVNNEQVRSVFSLDEHNPPNTSEELFLNAVDLRDGQQAEHYSPSIKEAIKFARAMIQFGMQGIEAGNPPAGEVEWEKVHRIAEEVGSLELPKPSQYGVYPRISALARLTHNDVVASLQAVQGAPNRGVHAYMSHSEIQFPFKFEGLRRTYDLTSDDFETFISTVVLPTIDRELKYIKDTDPDCHIRYSPEDWTRTRPDIAERVILKAAECGANCINLPDTLGIGNPFILAQAVHQIRTILDEHRFQHVTIAFHGHNDTTMAVANTMGAIIGGAREVDTTFLGTGERLGNPSTEGTVLMLDTQRQFLEQSLGVQLTDTLVREKLLETSLECAECFHRNGLPEGVPIVSDRSCEIGAGVHQAAHAAGEEAGVQKIYLPFVPEEFGTKTRYVIGPESGRGGLSQVMKHMELPFESSDLSRFASRMKQFCDVHRTVLRQEQVAEHIYYPTVVELTGGAYVTDEVNIHDDKSVTIVLRDGSTIDGSPKKRFSGAVDAITQALKTIIPSVEVDDFGGAMKHGGNGDGATSPDVSRARLKNDTTVTMHAEHIDTERAGILAVIKAFNALWAREQYEENIKGQL